MSAKTNQGVTPGSGPGTRGSTKWPETKFSTATEAQIFLIEKNLLDNENITILTVANALRLLATRTTPQNGLKEGILAISRILYVRRNTTRTIGPTYN